MLFLFYFFGGGFSLKFISLRTLRSMCLDFLIFLVPCALVLFSLPFLFRLFMPFIIGFFLYLLANPLNRFLLKQKLPRAFSSAAALLIISAVVFFILRTASVKIFAELRALITETSVNPQETFGFITKRVSTLLDAASLPFDTLGSIFSALSDALSGALTNLFSSLSTSLLNMAKNIPSLFIQIITAFITAFFLLKESCIVFSFFRTFFGEKAYEGFLKIKNTFLNVFLKYLKAQLIIGGIIFAVLLTGFLLLKLDYAFLLAIATALVDVVPVLGTGTVLIPLAIYNFLIQNISLGWGLVVLYGITLLTRQLCEPKIVGEKLGIHPLVTIFSIYLGMKLFGIWGLIFGPITAIFIKNLIFPE